MRDIALQERTLGTLHVRDALDGRLPGSCEVDEYSYRGEHEKCGQKEVGEYADGRSCICAVGWDAKEAGQCDPAAERGRKLHLGLALRPWGLLCAPCAPR